MNLVLDASALLAFYLDEPGADQVGAALEAKPYMTAVNFGEFVEVVMRAGGDPLLARALSQRETLTLVPVDDDLAVEAGLMWSATRRRGLSFADRCCLAFAQRVGLPALTGDRAWADIAAAVGVEVRLIR